MSQATTDLIGQKLSHGRYHVAAKLGEGGMGAVYRAVDTNLGKDVVIKVPHPMLLADPQFAARFAREIRSLVTLSHPHIVPIREVGEHEGLPFAVMDFLSGGSLEDQRPMNAAGQPQPAPPEQLADWLPDIAKTLDFVHGEGYVHRDVKPGNILFDRHGTVYLGDFGIVKALQPAGSVQTTRALTGTGLVLGTADYMAPELCDGRPFDGRVDQYALATTVYELLNGEVPFSATTPLAVLMRQMQDKPRPLHEIVPTIPRAVSGAVDRALSKTPDQRFASCLEFARAVLGAAKRPETASVAVVGTGAAPLACPQCGGPLNVLPKHGGRKVQCPRCQSVLRVSADLRQASLADSSDTSPASQVQRAAGSASGWVPPPRPPQPPTPRDSRSSGVGGAQTPPPVPARSRLDSPSAQPVRVAVPTGILPVYWLVGGAASVSILVVLALVVAIGFPDREDSTAEGTTPPPAVVPEDLPPKTGPPSVVEPAPIGPGPSAPPPPTMPKSVPPDPAPKSVPTDPFGSASPPERPSLAVAPFDAAAAKRHQQAWANYLGQPIELTNSIGMKLLLIPPGEFMMGSPASEAERDSDETQHRVRITKPYYLGVYEVTVDQFRAFVDARSYRTEGERDGKGGYGYGTDGKWSQKPEYTWRNVGFPQAADHPVVNVSWNDAVAFIEWLSDKEGRQYRLATEAEWEYACRAGTTTAYQHGDDPEGLAQVANVADGTAKAKFSGWTTISARDGYVYTAPVGSFRANAFGLYDMHGNVWEWCSDWYGDYPTTTVDDPTGAAAALASARVCRGGGWHYYAGGCRSAFRIWFSPSYRILILGFRLVAVQSAR